MKTSLKLMTNSFQPNGRLDVSIIHNVNKVTEKMNMKITVKIKIDNEFLPYEWKPNQENSIPPVGWTLKQKFETN